MQVLPNIATSNIIKPKQVLTADEIRRSFFQDRILPCPNIVMSAVSHVVKVSLPAYLEGLPIPDSILGWFSLSGKGTSKIRMFFWRAFFHSDIVQVVILGSAMGDALCHSVCAL